MSSPSLPRTLDSGYMGSESFAATYLLREGGRALFVETATARSVPGMLAALTEEGLSPADVEYVIITHVHLDHAGGASALMKACPEATLLAHPRAARHAIDPSKLVASASAVYGAERFTELYGAIEPIPEARVRVMSDGEILRFGTRELTFLHTRGHANHHFVIHDSGSRGVFTGDAFGLVYPALQTGGLLALPSTSPTDFDPAEAKASVARIVETRAERVYLTHFGASTEVQAIAAQLLEQLDLHEALLEEAAATALEGPALVDFCRPRIAGFFAAARARVGLAESDRAERILAMDADLNAQGVAFSAERRRKA
jgi:glyoxylase-like metal-dependent hydrolase (beta-lactamase superfamily II)